jgi:hypothetical protein
MTRRTGWSRAIEKGRAIATPIKRLSRSGIRHDVRVGFFNSFDGVNF